MTGGQSLQSPIDKYSVESKLRLAERVLRTPHITEAPTAAENGGAYGRHLVLCLAHLPCVDFGALSRRSNEKVIGTKLGD